MKGEAVTQQYETLQEVFDIAFAGLKKQNFAESLYSVEKPDGTTKLLCAYRGQNGTKCAAGHCIPDEIYQDSFEGKSVSGLGSADVNTLFRKVGVYNIEELQAAHDAKMNRINDKNWPNPHGYTDDIEANLRLFAKKHGLTVEGQQP